MRVLDLIKIEEPQQGDTFDIEISESEMITTGIVELVEDGIVIHADQYLFDLLTNTGLLEDARVPQKPRQGPLRPQTGAGKHKDKKKDQKQGKEKHKGKSLGEGSFGRTRDDQFSLSGRMPATDRIPQDSTRSQNQQQAMVAKMKQQTIADILSIKPGWGLSDLELMTATELNQILRDLQFGSMKEAVKKPNATTRHLRDYPVSDKDVAKPVKPEKKKDEKKAVAEGLQQTLRKVVPGYAKREIDKKMDAGKFGKTDADKDANFQRYKKIQDKLKEQGVAEGSDKLQGTPVVSLSDFDNKDNKKNKYGQTVPKKLKKDDPRVKFHKDDKKQGVAEGFNTNLEMELHQLTKALDMYDAIYDALGRDDEVGNKLQQMAIDISGETGLHGDDDIEQIISIIADRLEQSYGDPDLGEAEYQGRKVSLGKPMAGDVKKSKVYVKGPKGNVVKVNFGDKKMRIKKSNPGRRRNFRARHNCDNPGPRWKARYWSCRAW